MLGRSAAVVSWVEMSVGGVGMIGYGVGWVVSPT